MVDPWVPYPKRDGSARARADRHRGGIVQN